MNHEILLTQLLYGSAGLLFFLLGAWSFISHEPLWRKLIALNIMGAGVFHVLVAVAYRGLDAPPDPVPHALVLTGIVVAVSATALALAFGRRLDREAPEHTSDAHGGVDDREDGTHA